MIFRSVTFFTTHPVILMTFAKVLIVIAFRLFVIFTSFFGVLRKVAGPRVVTTLIYAIAWETTSFRVIVVGTGQLVRKAIGRETHE